jgi:hypothetical protein
VFSKKSHILFDTMRIIPIYINKDKYKNIEKKIFDFRSFKEIKKRISLSQTIFNIIINFLPHIEKTKKSVMFKPECLNL